MTSFQNFNVRIGTPKVTFPRKRAAFPAEMAGKRAPAADGRALKAVLQEIRANRTTILRKVAAI